MSQLSQYLVFRLNEQRYAVPLRVVERIVNAAEITPLPKAPEIVLGVLDIAGEVRPVLSLRRRFRKTDRTLRPSDQFLLAQAGSRPVALVIDEAEGVREFADGIIIQAHGIVPGLQQIQGVAVLEDGLVLIHDLEKFLSLDEAAALDAALPASLAHGH
jgi:purine-binding chemotaxis protein CheW